jgi:hypothetical protein
MKLKLAWKKWINVYLTENFLKMNSSKMYFQWNEQII